MNKNKIINPRDRKAKFRAGPKMKFSVTLSNIKYELPSENGVMNNGRYAINSS